MSKELSATARAHSNIAFIKYWGNTDDQLRLPANASISMNLAALHTTTTVRWSPDFESDYLTINGIPANEAAVRRTKAHLCLLREHIGSHLHAEVRSENNFPMGTGIASSASAFAALTLAGLSALDARYSERELSALARRGSGSAARSIPSGYVEWYTGVSHDESFAESFADATHWNLIDIIAVVSREHKRVDSTAGHATANTSILQPLRVTSAGERLLLAKNAILSRDFAGFAAVVEEDSNLMHSVMMTSKPALFYWQPASLEIMLAVQRWRQQDGLDVCYTLDAGPNVHCICTIDDADEVSMRLRQLYADIELLHSPAGGGAVILEVRNEK